MFADVSHRGGVVKAASQVPLAVLPSRMAPHPDRLASVVTTLNEETIPTLTPCVRRPASRQGRRERMQAVVTRTPRLQWVDGIRSDVSHLWNGRM